MKEFNIVKVGYSVGIYGCNAEYFIANIVDEKGLQSIGFQGMYGVESRVREVLEGKGFKFSYSQRSINFGKMTKKEGKFFLEETQMIDEVNSNY